MNERTDAFERELAAVEPTGVSPDLVESIGRALDEPTRTAWLPSVIGRIGLAAAACAVLAVSAVWLTSSGPDEPVTPRYVDLTDLQQAPTLLAYNLTMQRSFDELDDLLDRHSRRMLRATGPALHVGPAFIQPDEPHPTEVTP